ncbi:ABC transporter permease [Helicovermis profundi]|uniref:ABC transmembrane type-1 domain-containing protein n=1 Tax=Helicovermis profundi TaxID=3065157 RepID=A0AAU9EKX4_9FIRM|nr:hypothetical protein HLPR_09950 [Clostridia bacterium S502]
MAKISKDMWQQLPKEEKDKDLILRPSLTYWQDAWRRLKQNKFSMLGLATIIILAILATFAPMVIAHDYSSQNLSLANIPAKIRIYKVSDDSYVYVHREYKIYNVTAKGEILKRIREKEKNMKDNYNIYELNGNTIKLDYHFARLKGDKNPENIKFKLYVNDKEVSSSKNVRNKSYLFGTDTLGRDLLARVLFGARISLFIALIATVVNFFIGVVYGGTSGYLGGKIDNIMMRIVDIISVIPLLLYVILLTVLIGTGLKSIIIAIGSVYWVGMARIVRGQVLSLKEQEYVLAARTLGASTMRIMFRHLIPNAMGPIIVAMTMMIPSAIFTEAFLSFIGLGVSPPIASWGTLASDALTGLRSYPYQLFYPSAAICITMLAFNFLGDGLRDALDPRLRK